MTDKHEDIQKFLETLPEEFEILEERIDIQTQKEYHKHSDSFDQGVLTENETLELGNMLFNKNEPLDRKKRVLVLLAHLGNILAFRLIEQYSNHAGNELKAWTLLALQECKMFLESSLPGEDIGFISGGLGGLGNKLRFYFFVLPLNGQLFSKAQKGIIKDEFELLCKELNAVVETIHFSDVSIGFTVLVPLDVAIGVLIETGISKCNASGNFVFEHYYVTNGEIPDQSEISDIIKIVRE